MTEFKTGLPLTEAERKRDAADKHETLNREAARKKAARSGQRYDKPMTLRHRRIYDRMVGSE